VCAHILIAEDDVRQATVIRRYRPEVLISINYRDRWAGSFNHADHRAVGIALVDAARDAANRWVFPGAGGAPWTGLRFALFAGSQEATHAVDVTDTIDAGVASLKEHRAYLAGLPGGTTGTDPDAFLREMAQATGPSIGAAAALIAAAIGRESAISSGSSPTSGDTSTTRPCSIGIWASTA
jgi:LmbE family N-acetylglucosaminyl deacetylase